MREREIIEPLSIPKILSNEILSRFKKEKSPFLIKDVFNLKMTFPVGSEIYGLDLTETSDKVKGFIENLVKARSSEDPSKLNEFLKETDKLPDEFFDQPLGQYEDPNINPITLRQLNAALIEMFRRGIKFNFNGENNNQ